VPTLLKLFFQIAIENARKASSQSKMLSKDPSLIAVGIPRLHFRLLWVQGMEGRHGSAEQVRQTGPNLVRRSLNQSN